MYLNFENRLWLVNLFIILTFYIQTSCKVSLSDLKEMCCIDSRLKAIQSLPPNNNCTGIAWYSDGRTNYSDIDHLKGKLKKVWVYNMDQYFGLFTTYMTIPNMTDELVSLLSEIINSNAIDILIFENMFLERDDSGYNTYQMDIRRLILRLQKKNPNTICGLFLRFLPDLANIGVNLPYLEKVVPFFVLRSFDNYDCFYNKHQANMSLIDPVDEIENKVKEILTILNGEKLCIGIRIIVKSTKGSLTADYHEDESYTDFCTKKASKHRRYCIETLPHFYKKGRLVSKYHLAGAFVQSFDRDDYGCKCGCGCYPVMTAIDAGIQGLPEPLVTNCSTWTLLKKDRD